jgi:hypothetical protein
MLRCNFCYLGIVNAGLALLTIAVDPIHLLCGSKLLLVPVILALQIRLQKAIFSAKNKTKLAF